MILHPPVRGSLRAWATGNRNLILNALPAAFTSRGSLAGAIADHVPLETLQRCGKPSSSGLSIKGVFTGSDWGDTKISRIAWSRGRRLGFPVSLFCSPSASFRGRLSPRGGGGGLRRQQGESPSLLTGPGKVRFQPSLSRGGEKLGHLPGARAGSRACSPEADGAAERGTWVSAVTATDDPVPRNRSRHFAF